MHIQSFASIVVAAASLVAVSAAPTGIENLQPRSCAIEYPSFLSYVDSFSPDKAFGNSNLYSVNKETGGPPARDALIQFSNIPSGSLGCQLEAWFPAGYKINTWGSTQMYFYSVDREISAADTWNNSPGKVSMIGTAVFTPSTGDTRVVINSVQCAPSLSFRVAMSSDAPLGGGVEFLQSVDVNAPAGFRITHNC